MAHPSDEPAGTSSPTAPFSPSQVGVDTANAPQLPSESQAYNEICVGLDFGGLYSRVAQAHPKDPMPTIVRNNLSNEQTPSIISFRQRQERFYGDDAVPHLTSQPQSTAYNLKQLIGGAPSPEGATAYNLHFAVDDTTHAMCLKLEDGERSLTPTHLVGMLLKQLLRFARQQRNVPAAVLPARVVAAAPSYFSEAQRAALSGALVIAGIPLDRVHVIPEAVAELICFHHSHYSELHMSDPVTVALVDVGHSQSFVTIATVTKMRIEVLATRGAPVGSGIVDRGLVRDAVQHVLTTRKVDLALMPKALARLEKEARKVKEMLSMLDQVDLTVDSLTEEVDIIMRVHRDTVVQHAGPLAETVAQLCAQAMEAAGPSVLEAISRVEILGGGLRMPALQERLRSVWSRPLLTTMDGSLSLAQGCALYGLLQPPTEETSRILLSLVSKVDEARRLMDTLHCVELVPPIDAAAMTLSAEELARSMEAEADLQARDNRLVETAVARNALEAYVYGTRGSLDAPEMQKALGEEADKVRGLLSQAEEWLWDAAEDSPAAIFIARLEELKAQIAAGFPAFTRELERQAEERARRDAELAEEPRRAAAENKKEPRSDEERLKFAEERKEQGNQLLKQEHHQEAITRYVQSLAYLGEIYSSDEPELKARKDAIALSCHLNIAAAAIKIGLHQKAIDNSDRALQLQPTSAKAYFRKGQALSLKSDFDGAKKSLEKALELAPGDKLIEKEIKLNAKKMEQHKAKEKKMFANMFSS